MEETPPRHSVLTVSGQKRPLVQNKSRKPTLQFGFMMTPHEANSTSYYLAWSSAFGIRVIGFDLASWCLPLFQDLNPRF